MKMIKQVAFATIALLMALSAQAASTVHKPADAGAYWQPLSTGSSYVYADSFIAPESGTPTSLGAFLLQSVAGVPSVRFEVWGDNNGPDSGNVIGATASFTPAVDGTLQFFSEPVATVLDTMTVGEVYWFVATVVGEPAAAGSYQVGAHTQNSVCVDNGTFWFSNDPAGISFDGQNLTPEMAFEVQINGGGNRACGSLVDNTVPVPVPTLDQWGLLLLLLLAGISGMVFVRARTS